MNDQAISELTTKKHAYSVRLGGALRLFVTSRGIKTFRAIIQGKSITLGRFPEISINEAREEQIKHRTNILNTEMRFNTLAKQFIQNKRTTSGTRNIQRFEGLLNNHILPHLGNKYVFIITKQDIYAVLALMINQQIIESTHRALDCINAIFNLAVGMGLVRSNPCLAMKTVLPRKPTVRSYPAITQSDDFKQFLVRAEATAGGATIKKLITLAAHWFLRPGELIRLEWRFVNPKKNLIELPDQYTKNGILREIPISRVAKQRLAELYQLRSQSPESEYLFSINGQRPISDTAIRNHLKKIDTNHSFHGFRASARTLIREELNVERDVIEHQLDHVPADNNGIAYNRTQLLTARTQMMQCWSDWIEEAINNPLAPDSDSDDDMMYAWFKGN